MDTYICIVVNNDEYDRFEEIAVVKANSEDEAIDRASRNLPADWYVHTVAIATAERGADIMIEVL